MSLGVKFFIAPFLAWFVTGVLKFFVNCIREKRIAFDLIGYGGFPSNHSSIVTTVSCLIAFTSGIDSPAFGVAVCLAFIVVLDANGLRRHIGRHAITINQITLGKQNYIPLRERIGHTKLELLSGILVGIAIGYLLSLI